MGRIRTDTRLCDIGAASKNFSKLSKWLFLHNKATQATIEERYGAAAATLICEALNSWEDETLSGVSGSANLYSREEIEKDREKGRTHLFFMPGEPGAPWVLVCPGGAYTHVALLGEGFSTALALNRLGYNAFILQYRVGKTGLMPDPLDDVAQAVRRIRALSRKYNVARDDYAVVGYSAGGHLAAQWGTAGNGYAKYGLKKPGAIILGYPALSTAVYYEMVKSGELDEFKLRGVAEFLSAIVGSDLSWLNIQAYSAERHVTDEYPPTYMINCEDDPLVPLETVRRMAAALELAGVEHKLRIEPIGGHGFGPGMGTSREGWLEEASEFWRRHGKQAE